MKVLVLLVFAACGSSSSPTERRDEPPAPKPREEPVEPGFQLTRSAIKSLLLDVNGHVVVLKSQATFGEYRDVQKTVAAHAQVTLAAPFVFAEMRGRKFGDYTATGAVEMAVKAIEPGPNLQRLERYIVRGSLHTLATATVPPAIVLGDGLAKELGVEMGDRVTLSLLQDDPWQVRPDGGVPSSMTFLVGGLFHMTYEEYDKRLAFTSIAPVQTLIGRGDQVTGIEARVKDPTASAKVAEDVTRALGGAPYLVQDWFEQNRAFFKTRD